MIPGNGRRRFRRFGTAALLALVLFALLSVSVLAAGQSLALPYGELRFESASLEGTVTCGGETLPVYAMAPGPLVKKIGISPDTEIAVYHQRHRPHV